MNDESNERQSYNEERKKQRGQDRPFGAGTDLGDSHFQFPIRHMATPLRGITDECRPNFDQQRSLPRKMSAKIGRKLYAWPMSALPTAVLAALGEWTGAKP